MKQSMDPHQGHTPPFTLWKSANASYCVKHTSHIQNTTRNSTTPLLENFISAPTQWHVTHFPRSPAQGETSRVKSGINKIILSTEPLKGLQTDRNRMCRATRRMFEPVSAQNPSRGKKFPQLTVSLVPGCTCETQQQNTHHFGTAGPHSGCIGSATADLQSRSVRSPWW